MVKVKVLIVLYNKHIFESETCQSLVNVGNIHSKAISEIYIWNNSSFLLQENEKNLFDSDFPNARVYYFEDCKNYPLSVVYNTIISRLDTDGGLLILDHDSTFDENFIKEIQEGFNDYPNINLFLPRIYYHSTMVSPARQYYFYGRYLKQEIKGVVKSQFLTAINSGMFIRCSYLKNEFEGYNEKIKFYGTDNDFMYKYSKKNKYIYVLNARINHELNYYEDISLEKRLHRYKDIRNGIIEQMKSINSVLYFFSRIYLLYYECRMNVKYCTMRFFNLK